MGFILAMRVVSVADPLDNFSDDVIWDKSQIRIEGYPIYYIYILLLLRYISL